MKTVKQWLEELPEEYREKALKNAYPEMLNYQFESQEQALPNSFGWSYSPEGFDYWNNLYESLLKTK